MSEKWIEVLKRWNAKLVSFLQQLPRGPEEGFIDKMNELDEKSPRYIDLIEFEVRKETPYKTAKQTIMENIVRFSDEDDNEKGLIF